jgi:hypothetical protein
MSTRLRRRQLLHRVRSPLWQFLRSSLLTAQPLRSLLLLLLLKLRLHQKSPLMRWHQMQLYRQHQKSLLLSHQWRLHQRSLPQSLLLSPQQRSPPL